MIDTLITATGVGLFALFYTFMVHGSWRTLLEMVDKAKSTRADVSMDSEWDLACDVFSPMVFPFVLLVAYAVLGAYLGLVALP